MLRAKEEGTPAPQPHFGKIDDPIEMMEAEHDEAGAIFKQISEGFKEAFKLFENRVQYF